MDFLRRTWAEIDLDNALRNWNNIKKYAGGRYIMPVVKADAYGHGAKILAKLYEDNGADGFAVSNINEAIKLRKYGVKSDILVLGFTPVQSIQQIHDFHITQAIYSAEYAKQLSEAARRTDLTVKAHIKLDTGMCRIGFHFRNEEHFDESYRELLDCLKLPSLQFEGLFTHFSSADSENADDTEFSDAQYRRFLHAAERLAKDGYRFKYIHCCNSAASALRSSDEGNLIRPGIILYGLPPASGLTLKYPLLPVMSIKSVVSMVKDVSPDECVSYGRTYKTQKNTRIATIPIGYADGYPRALSNIGRVLIHGKFARITGRVCMDQIMVDVTGIDGVDIGTIVTLVGTDGQNSITFDDIAGACGTISYEMMCNVSVRMPRVYRKNNQTTDVVYLGGTL